MPSSPANHHYLRPPGDRSAANGEYFAGPTIDIHLLDGGSHAAHAAGAFDGIHGQGLIDFVRDLVGSIGIDAKGVFQFAMGTSEAAKNKHAVVVHAAGAVFFGDKVHAVVQGIYDEVICRKVQGGHFQHAVVRFQQVKGLPLSGSPAFIDGPGQLSHFPFSGLIGGQVRAAGCRDLHETHAATPVRMPLEKRVQGPEPVGDAFGEIHAFDAASDDNIGSDAQLVPPHSGSSGFADRGGLLGLTGEVNADGERPHHGFAAAPGDGPVFAVYAGLNVAVHGIEEILAMEIGD